VRRDTGRFKALIESLVVVSIVSSLGGCAAHGGFRPANTSLEKAIFLVEQEGSHTHSLSSTDNASTAVTRVPLGIEVDVESVIRIDVHPAEIEGGGSAAVALRASILAARADTLRHLLQAISENTEAYGKALVAFASVRDASLREIGNTTNLRDLNALSTKADAAEQAMVVAAASAFPDGSPQHRAAEAALLKLDSQPGLLTDVVQPELDRIETDLKRLGADVGTSKQSLRLEAFLESPGKQPLAIHLEGYDRLDAQSIQSLDRFGLNLSPAEQAALEKAAKSSSDLAVAAERLRSGQSSVKDAFDGLQSDAAKQIAAIATEATDLAAECKSQAVTARSHRIEQAAKAFRDSLRRAAPALAEAQIAVFDRVLSDALAALRSDSPQWDAALTQLIALGNLRSPRESPEALLAWVTGIREAAGSAREALKEQSPLRIALEPVTAKVDELVLGLPSDAAMAVRQCWQTADLRTQYEELTALVKRIEAIGQTAGYLLLGFQQVPAPPSLRAPEGFDVDLEMAPATAIELQRTPRIARDRVTLRASLVEDARVKESMVASFTVARLGWSAELAPSVVIIRPDVLPKGKTDGRFAPAVAYLVTYGPRDGETGRWCALARCFQPGFGLHAAFLNYRPDAQNDIGLGLITSLWRGTAQAGVGLNLFEPRHDRGGLYYSFGSNLVPILQRLGAPGGSDGK